MRERSNPIFTLLLGAALGSSLVFATAKATPRDKPLLFDEAYRLIIQKHVRAKDLDVQKLQQEAIKKLVEGLEDKHAHYREKEKVVPPKTDKGNDFVKISDLVLTPPKIYVQKGSTPPATVSGAVPAKIGYLKVFSFDSTDVGAALENNIENFRRSEIRGLVIDLRNNLGGHSKPAIDVAGIFLDRDTVVALYVDSNGTVERHTSDSRLAGALKDVPVVLLVNGNTASASELFTGALRDNRRVPVVGQKTYGKGTSQISWKLSDGSELKLTTYRWHTPGGYSIQGKGFTPDHVIIVLEEDIKSGKVRLGEPGKDPQLDKALELLSPNN